MESDSVLCFWRGYLSWCCMGLGCSFVVEHLLHVPDTGFDPVLKKFTYLMDGAVGLGAIIDS